MEYWRLSCDYTSAASVADALLSEALHSRAGVEVEVYYFRGWASRYDCEATDATELCEAVGMGASGRVEIRGRLAGLSSSDDLWLAFLKSRRGCLAALLEGSVHVERGEGVRLRGVRGEFSSAYNVGQAGGAWRRMELEAATLSFQDLQGLAAAVDALLGAAGLGVSWAMLAEAQGGVALSLGGPGLELVRHGEERVRVRRPADPQGPWRRYNVDGVEDAVARALIALSEARA